MTTATDETPRWKIALSLCSLGMMIILIFLITKLVHRIKFLRLFITESGLTLALGLIVGLINYFSGSPLGELFQFNTYLFDFLILPAIIFESGYSLKKKGLFSNLTSIVLYAVVGTLISALFIGGMTYVFARFAGVDSLETSTPVEALVFGSIVSAIDPVASLAILSDVFRVKESPDAPKLYTVIFGESVINDAVSIVLFRIFLKYINTTSFGPLHFLEMAGTFVYVSLGSVAVGLVVAFLSALFFKHVSFKEHNAAEVITLSIWAYSSYLLAEAASLSGIMSLFVCGIFMGRYTWHNLSDYSQLTTPQTYKSLASLSDTYVFLYLGLAAFGLSDIHEWRFGFIGISLVLCFVGRILNIIPLTLIANIWRKEKFSIRETIMLTFTGLRGAIAFALALHTIGITPNANEIVTATLVIVIFTVWVIGGLSYPMLKLLKLDKQTQEETGHSSKTLLLINKGVNNDRFVHEDQLSENLHEPAVIGRAGDSWVKRINKRFIVPFFRRKGANSQTLRDLLFTGAIADHMNVVEVEHRAFTELQAIIEEKTHISELQDEDRNFADGEDPNETNNTEMTDIEIDEPREL